MEELEKILALDLTDLEKMTRAFRWITDEVIWHSQHEVELLRALEDQQALVKEQVKLSTIRHAQSIYAQVHLMVTGKVAWDEPVKS